jgi:hypothetical protein
MDNPNQIPIPQDYISESLPSTLQIRFGLVTTLFGFLVFLLGAKPSLFFPNAKPYIGFIKISVFLIGLAIICIGGYISLIAYWKNSERTIAADIGSRLVATGYVVAVFSGMADVFGFGTQPLPETPYFGPWQAFGVMVGEAIISIGFLLLIQYHRRK